MGTRCPSLTPSSAARRSGLTSSSTVRLESLTYNLQVVAKAMRFARLEEREYGAFILRQLAEERAQDERGKGVQRIAPHEEVAKLSLGHVLRSKLQLACLLTEGPELFLIGGSDLIEFHPLRRLGPRLGDEPQQFVDGFFKRDVLEPAPNLVPLGPLPARQPIGVQREILVQNAQNEERLGGAGGKFGQRLERIQVGIRGMCRGVLQQFPQLIEDKEEAADLVRRARNFEGFCEQLCNRMGAGLLPRRWPGQATRRCVPRRGSSGGFRGDQWPTCNPRRMANCSGSRDPVITMGRSAGAAFFPRPPSPRP